MLRKKSLQNNFYNHEYSDKSYTFLNSSSSQKNTNTDYSFFSKHTNESIKSVASVIDATTTQSLLETPYFEKPLLSTDNVIDFCEELEKCWSVSQPQITINSSISQSTSKASEENFNNFSAVKLSKNKNFIQSKISNTLQETVQNSISVSQKPIGCIISKKINENQHFLKNDLIFETLKNTSNTKLTPLNNSGMLNYYTEEDKENCSMLRQVSNFNKYDKSTNTLSLFGSQNNIKYTQSLAYLSCATNESFVNPQKINSTLFLTKQGTTNYGNVTTPKNFKETMHFFKKAPSSSFARDKFFHIDNSLDYYDKNCNGCNKNENNYEPLAQKINLDSASVITDSSKTLFFSGSKDIVHSSLFSSSNLNKVVPCSSKTVKEFSDKKYSFPNLNERDAENFSTPSYEQTHENFVCPSSCYKASSMIISEPGNVLNTNSSSFKNSATKNFEDSNFNLHINNSTATISCNNFLGGSVSDSYSRGNNHGDNNNHCYNYDCYNTNDNNNNNNDYYSSNLINNSGIINSFDNTSFLGNNSSIEMNKSSNYIIFNPCETIISKNNNTNIRESVSRPNKTYDNKKQNSHPLYLKYEKDNQNSWMFWKKFQKSLFRYMKKNVTCSFDLIKKLKKIFHEHEQGFVTSKELVITLKSMVEKRLYVKICEETLKEAYYKKNGLRQIGNFTDNNVMKHLKEKDCDKVGYFLKPLSIESNNSISYKSNEKQKFDDVLHKLTQNNEKFSKHFLEKLDENNLGKLKNLLKNKKNNGENFFENCGIAEEIKIKQNNEFYGYNNYAKWLNNNNNNNESDILNCFNKQSDYINLCNEHKKKEIQKKDNTFKMNNKHAHYNKHIYIPRKQLLISTENAYTPKAKALLNRDLEKLRILKDKYINNIMNKKTKVKNNLTNSSSNFLKFNFKFPCSALSDQSTISSVPLSSEKEKKKIELENIKEIEKKKSVQKEYYNEVKTVPEKKYINGKKFNQNEISYSRKENCLNNPTLDFESTNKAFNFIEKNKLPQKSKITQDYIAILRLQADKRKIFNFFGTDINDNQVLSLYHSEPYHRMKCCTESNKRFVQSFIEPEAIHEHLLSLSPRIFTKYFTSPQERGVVKIEKDVLFVFQMIIQDRLRNIFHYLVFLYKHLQNSNTSIFQNCLMKGHNKKEKEGKIILTLRDLLLLSATKMLPHIPPSQKKSLDLLISHYQNIKADFFFAK